MFTNSWQTKSSVPLQNLTEIYHNSSLSLCLLILIQIFDINMEHDLLASKSREQQCVSVTYRVDATNKEVLTMPKSTKHLIQGI